MTPEEFAKKIAEHYGTTWDTRAQMDAGIAYAVELIAARDAEMRKLGAERMQRRAASVIQSHREEGETDHRSMIHGIEFIDPATVAEGQ